MTSHISERNPSLSSLIGGFYGEGSTEQSQAMSREVLTQLFVDNSRAIRQEEADAGLPLLEGCPLPLDIQRIVVSYFVFDRALEELKKFERTHSGPDAIRIPIDLFAVEDLCRKTRSAFDRNLQSILVCRIQSAGFLALQQELGPFSGFGYPSKRENIHRDWKFVLERWEKQWALDIKDIRYSDAELEKLLVCTRLKNLTLSNCPNLFTLSCLSLLTNLQQLSLELNHLRNEQRKEYLTLKDIDLEDDKALHFDLSKFNLPHLERLTLTNWPPKLFVIDARNCKNLRHIFISILFFSKCYMNEKPPFSNRVLDVRGLTCEVTICPNREMLLLDPMPSQNTILTRKFIDAIVILKDEPTAQTGAGAAGELSIPAGLSLS